MTVFDKCYFFVSVMFGKLVEDNFTLSSDFSTTLKIGITFHLLFVC